jgi:hypothetical protein
MRVTLTLSIFFAVIFEGNAMAASTQLTYLRDRTIHQITLGAMDAVVSASTWSLPENMNGRVEFGDLSCFSEQKFLSTMARIPSSEALGPSVRSVQVMDYATRTFEPLFPESTDIFVAPLTSPDRKYVAMLRRPRSGDTFALALFDVEKKTTTFAESKVLSVPTAWTADSSAVFLGKENASTRKWEIVKYELSKNRFESVREGLLPIVNPSTNVLAYLSSDRMILQTLAVDGQTASPVQKVFFKDLIGWRGANEILFTSGSGYDDMVGIASLDTGKTKLVRVPGAGEIRGACALFQ